MTSINGLTNPFENAVMSLNENQLTKQKRLDDYSTAIERGYEPPLEILDAIAAIVAQDVLSPEDEAALAALLDDILADLAPIITSNGGGDTTTIDFEENSTEVVTTVVAEDRYGVEGDLTYSIVGGTNALLFDINALTGELTFLTPPDYEADQVSFEVTVQVSDGGILIDTQTITVNVTDLNDTAPTITSNDGGANAAISVAENSTIVTTVTSDDPDTLGTATYSIVGGDDFLAFTINASTGELSFSDAPDYEVPADFDGDNVYDVTVQVSDGIQTDTQAIAVMVTDVEEGPPLPATFGFVLNGISAGDRSGEWVASAGDVNGDGIDDILISTFAADPNGILNAGQTYLVFGKDTALAGAFDATFDLSTLDGTNGFVMNGTEADAFNGFKMGSAGDVNGDGIDDILIGAFRADPDGRVNAGESYVVFGKDTDVTGNFAASIVLDTLDGSNGFVLNGIDSGDLSGYSVASAGDVNADGIDDMLIGAIRSEVAGARFAGETYVVFGKDTAVTGDFEASFDLASLDGSNGFVLSGIDAFDNAGYFVASAGDVNGDGIDDILTSALGADGQTGETYVVFGKDTAATSNFDASFDLDTLDGTNGFVMKGINPQDWSGFAVASAGDINGDGIGDVMISAVRAAPGEVYVVFGKDTDVTGDFAASIDLADLATGDGSTGFVLKGIEPLDSAGVSIASAGDVNGDGIDDILIGADAAAGSAAFLGGETYLVFGKDTADEGNFVASFDLGTLDGSDGFVFKGINNVDRIGHSVSSAGDMNNDGIDDILISGYLADPNDMRDAGETYVVFGGGDLLALYDAADGVSDGAINLSLLSDDPMAFV